MVVGIVEYVGDFWFFCVVVWIDCVVDVVDCVEGVGLVECDV